MAYQEEEIKLEPGDTSQEVQFLCVQSAKAVMASLGSHASWGACLQNMSLWRHFTLKLKPLVNIQLLVAVIFSVLIVTEHITNHIKYNAQSCLRCHLLVHILPITPSQRLTYNAHLKVPAKLFFILFLPTL